MQVSGVCDALTVKQICPPGGRGAAQTDWDRSVSLSVALLLPVTIKALQALKCRKPSLAAFHPYLIGRNELVGLIQSTEMHFDFVVRFGIDG